MKDLVYAESREFLRGLIEVIRERYQGKVSIILFGSRARGTSSDRGDFDIMVVLEKMRDPVNEAVEIRKRIPLRGRFPLDLVFVEVKDLKSKLIKQMLKDKKVLFDGLNLMREGLLN
ncbi:MAG: nucleotidyltransferase domain-containing protein [Candidatus Njordarchaeia archaeon]